MPLLPIKNSLINYKAQCVWSNMSAQSPIMVLLCARSIGGHNIVVNIHTPAPIARVIVHIRLRSQLPCVVPAELKSITTLYGAESPPLAFRHVVIRATKKARTDVLVLLILAPKIP